MSKKVKQRWITWLVQNRTDGHRLRILYHILGEVPGKFLHLILSIASNADGDTYHPHRHNPNKGGRGY